MNYLIKFPLMPLLLAMGSFSLADGNVFPDKKEKES